MPNDAITAAAAATTAGIWLLRRVLPPLPTELSRFEFVYPDEPAEPTGSAPQYQGCSCRQERYPCGTATRNIHERLHRIDRGHHAGMSGPERSAGHD
jgi:hypothetical protein